MTHCCVPEPGQTTPIGAGMLADLDRNACDWFLEAFSFDKLSGVWFWRLGTKPAFLSTGA